MVAKLGFNFYPRVRTLLSCGLLVGFWISGINKGYKKSSTSGHTVVGHISLTLLLLFSSGDSFGSYTDCKNRVHTWLNFSLVYF